MSTLEAFLLGVLQGLGEFLPISSSGHLIAVPWLLGWPEHSLAFDVALHLGTLVAVLGAFAGDWWRLVTGSLRALRAGRVASDEHVRLLLLLALGSLPGALAGLALDEWAETVFRSPALVALTLSGMGLVLLLADRRATVGAGGDLASVGWRDALLIGLAQGVAIVPGVSRSGATISMALFLRYRREEAARFSFLLATPITAGAALLKLPKFFAGGGDFTPVLIGMGAAAVFGFLSIRLLLGWVRTRDYTPFVIYRWALAALIVSVLLLRG